MAICVEFFGIARERAGVAGCQLESPPATLGDCLRAIGGRFPRLAAECFDRDRLQPAYAANLGGQRFVRDPKTPIPDGATLLILSADGGG